MQEEEDELLQQFIIFLKNYVSTQYIHEEVDVLVDGELPEYMHDEDDGFLDGELPVLLNCRWKTECFTQQIVFIMQSNANNFTFQTSPYTENFFLTASLALA